LTREDSRTLHLNATDCDVCLFPMSCRADKDDFTVKCHGQIARNHTLNGHQHVYTVHAHFRTYATIDSVSGALFTLHIPFKHGTAHTTRQTFTFLCTRIDALQLNRRPQSNRFNLTAFLHSTYLSPSVGGCGRCNLITSFCQSVRTASIAPN
jgi:hypothetical protein